MIRKMEMTEEIKSENERALELVSFYLNFMSDNITAEAIEAITGGDESFNDYAFSALMAASCGLDAYGNSGDKFIFKKYFVPMIKGLSEKEYTENPYYQNVRIPNEVFGKWRLETKEYKPYEAFVYDDIEMRTDGRVLPRIGYFNQKLEYPCVSENGREWMTVTPNEINTMKKAINSAFGNVLTFGLGLGYYTYMVSLKDEVSTVTVVERDREVIELFEKFILPQFEKRDKVRIICADAFEFADNNLANGGFNHIFTDLWHDPSDGMDLYLEMKKREPLCPGVIFEYWIEKTIKLYLGE